MKTRMVLGTLLTVAIVGLLFLDTILFKEPGRYPLKVKVSSAEAKADEKNENDPHSGGHVHSSFQLCAWVNGSRAAERER